MLAAPRRAIPTKNINTRVARQQSGLMALVVAVEALAGSAALHPSSVSQLPCSRGGTKWDMGERLTDSTLKAAR